MELLMELDKIVRVFKEVFNDEDLEVSYNQLIILTSISNGNNSIKDISQNIAIDRSYIFRIINQLTEDGFLDKKGCRYNTYFTLTFKGKRVVNESIELFKFIFKNDLNEDLEHFQDNFKSKIKNYSKILYSRYH